MPKTPKPGIPQRLISEIGTISLLRGAFNKFPDFLYRHLKLSYTLENSVSYCYTFYETTDQFLGFQLPMNSYSRNGNTPY